MIEKMMALKGFLSVKIGFGGGNLQKDSKAKGQKNLPWTQFCATLFKEFSSHLDSTILYVIQVLYCFNCLLIVNFKFIINYLKKTKDNSIMVFFIY